MPAPAGKVLPGPVDAPEPCARARAGAVSVAVASSGAAARVPADSSRACLASRTTDHADTQRARRAVAVCIPAAAGAGAGPVSTCGIMQLGWTDAGARTHCALPSPPLCSLFRWCPTYPDYFAISTGSPAKGAVIHVHNVVYPHAQPTAFHIAQRPLYVRSFDFVACRGIPRIVAAVGREVVVFYIGVDS